MPTPKYRIEPDLTARFERCKGCHLCISDRCTHDKSVEWRRVGSEASVGRQPWCWTVEICPEGKEVKG